MSDIEDIMRHLNLRQDVVTSPTVVEQPVEEPPVIQEPQEEETPAQETSISDDEFNALIGDFSDPEDIDATSLDEYDRIAEDECRQSEEGEYTEDSDGFRGFHPIPLTAAEAAAQANALEGMPVREVHFHMSDGSQVDVPIERRDLDAEEDADWDNAIANGSLVPLDSNGEPIDPTADDPDEEEDQQESFLIAENSPTLQIDETTARFSGAQWYDKIRNKRIIIAGIGGIGSNAAYQIARLHPARLMLYDSDVVDAVNMAGQLYCNGDIGNSKVSALDRMIRNYTTLGEIYTVMDNFTDTSPAGDIMICGFDNMEARKTFFESWMRHVELVPDAHKRMCLLIDGRLDMSNLQVFCLTGDDTYNINRYKEEFLFSDSEAEHTVCSMKQTTYLACMIGSIITNLLVNFTTNLTDPVLPYDLPFLTEYDAQNIIFKTTN